MSVGWFLEVETDINQLSASVYITVGWVSKNCENRSRAKSDSHNEHQSISYQVAMIS